MNTTTFPSGGGPTTAANPADKPATQGFHAAPDASSPTRAALTVQADGLRPGAVFLSVRHFVWWSIRRVAAYGLLIAGIHWRFDGPLWLVASCVLAIAVPATGVEILLKCLAEDFRADQEG